MSFKFQIGDVVIHRAGIQDALMFAAFGEIRGVPKAFVITGTYAETCSGGTQLKYGVGDGQPLLHECELASPDEFPAEELVNMVGKAREEKWGVTSLKRNIDRVRESVEDMKTESSTDNAK